MTTPKIPKVLRAERIELVDSEGRVRCRIGPRQVSRGHGGGSDRTFDFDLFDARGDIAVKITTELKSGDAHVSLGKWPNANMSLYTRSYTIEPHPMSHQAGISIDSGSIDGRGTSRWDLRVTEGTYPEVSRFWPEILWWAKKPPTITDRGTLNMAVEQAESQLTSMRKSVEKSRAAGDAKGMRSEQRQVRQFTRLIEATKAAFQARHDAWNRFHGFKTDSEREAEKTTVAS